MTWVKVCGLTRPEHIRAAEAAGADAIGIVLIDASPRAVDEVQAARLAAVCGVTSVILTLDLAAADLLALAERLGVAGVQPYGRHAPEAATAAAGAGLFVLRPLSTPQLDTIGSLPATEIPLVDHRTADQLGGTGVVLDWSRLAGVRRNFVLAGGLNPGNVTEAIEVTGAWGVDASSGLESTPGVKDVGLIEAFVKEAKRV